MRSLYLAPLVLGSVVHAHQAFWHKAMYCLEGNSGSNNENSNDIISPLYQLPKSQWWMHAVNNCDKFPPPAGTFLELPAGGSFSGEIANNRAFTSLGFNGQYAGDWPDGTAAPIIPSNGDCISSPLLHAHGESDAAGTAFAISYVSDIGDVTPENLVVFTVAYNTPWRRQISYDVPAAMPACPSGGCICAWGWVPNHCGQPNMYMTPFKCKVTGATSTTPVAPGKPPTWCEGNQGACTKGAKQMIYFNQADGNNVDVSSGYQADGSQKSPNYNMKMGFANGAQNDIFGGAPSSPPPKTTTHAAVAPPAVQTTSVATHLNVAVTTKTTSKAAPTTTSSSTVSESTSPATSTSLSASSAKASHCSSKAKRNAAKQILDRHRKRAVLDVSL